MKRVRIQLANKINVFMAKINLDIKVRTEINSIVNDSFKDNVKTEIISKRGNTRLKYFKELFIE